MKRENLSVEQMCRNLLEAAYRDGITSTAEAQFLIGWRIGRHGEPAQ